MDEKTPDNARIAMLEREVARLRRLVKRLGGDNHALAKMNENAERLRRFSESEKKLQYLYNDLLLANCPNQIFLFDETLRYVVGSRACRAITGRDHKELLHKTFDWVFSGRLSSLWLCRLRDECTEAMAFRRAKRYDDAICMESGGCIKSQVAIMPILEEGNVCRGVILAITDVGELVEARAKAESALRARSAFLASMSHEIRTPMAAIKGLGELMELTRLDEIQRTYIEHILNASNSLIGIVNDVLDFSKIDADKVEIVDAPYSVSKLLSDVCGIIGMRAEDRGLALLVDVDPSLPARMLGDENHLKQILVNLLSNAVKYTPSGSVSFVVRTAHDADGVQRLMCSVKDTGIGIREEDIPLLFDAFARVDQQKNKGIIGTGLGLAISHRLANAMGGDIIVESAYGSGSTFTLSVPQQSASDVALAAVDQGGGVLVLGSGPQADNIVAMLERLGVERLSLWPMDDPEGILEEVSRIERVSPLGSGGISHCIYLEEAPGGLAKRLRSRLLNCRFAYLRGLKDMTVAHNEQDSVLFTPLLVTELADFLNQGSMRSLSQRTPTRRGDSNVVLFRDTTILVVDDNRINLLVCEKMLRRLGVSAETAESGEEALSLCENRKFDLVFMDQVMPGLDGMETSREIRSREGPNQATPIVAFTASLPENALEYFQKSGMNDFMSKPIEQNNLSHILRRWLPKNKVLESTA